MKRVIQAGVFKAKCLKIMDEVQRKKIPVTITKRKTPIVKLVPIEDEEQSLFGKMKGTVYIKGDIIQSIGEDWNACL